MDLYGILESETTATANELKKAYYKLSKQHHPDHGGDEEKFKEIAEAYQILSDPIRRKLYDVDGIILNDTENQTREWVKSTFAQMVEVWIKSKLNNQPISTLQSYIRERIKENRQKAQEVITDLKDKKTALKRYEKIVKVSEGENFFTIALKRVSDEINDGLREANTLVYRSDRLNEEFKRYEFENMEDDEALRFISMFGNSTTGSSTVHFRSPWDRG